MVQEINAVRCNNYCNALKDLGLTLCQTAPCTYALELPTLSVPDASFCWTRINATRCNKLMQRHLDTGVLVLVYPFSLLLVRQDMKIFSEHARATSPDAMI